MNSRSAEETLAAIERALAEESLGQSGKMHLSWLLVQHYGEAGDTEELRLTIHKMLNDGVADCEFPGAAHALCGKAQLGRCACTPSERLREGRAATRHFVVSTAYS